jgi:hypothetical protein
VHWAAGHLIAACRDRLIIQLRLYRARFAFDTWASVHAALVDGYRGLPGGSSLAQLLAEERGVRNIHMLPLLRKKQIIRWADDHHNRTGDWPTQHSGPIVETPGETWNGVNHALERGTRGLRGSTTLASSRIARIARRLLPCPTPRRALPSG